ncbi:MAG TPA: alpha-amylase family glycosyl hydrolase [Mucilaginibacter sp.]
MNSLLLIIMSALFGTGCGKSHNNPTPTPIPKDTTTTSTYKDPAQYGTPYAGIPATKDIVMYEVNTQTYTPANFQGVTARLDSIRALGVNVIWLMPTYPIGVLKAVGSPYAVKDYNGVNANFGTLDELRNLVTQAHSRNIAVIMDWVADHTSWDNAWITNKSWYKQDASGNITIPPGTNYADVAALNYNSSAMRTAMIRAMKYWVLTANIDGYRCDYADAVPADFWTQALDTLNNIKTHKLILLAEGTAGAEITSGFQMSYAFNFYSTLKDVFAGAQSPSALFTTNNNEATSLPSPGVKLRYITNHDDASSDGSTITEYNGKQGALAAFAIAAYMGGVPLIYDSQEVGYPNSINFFTNVPVDYTANPDMVAAYKQIIAFRSAHEAVKTGALTPYNDSNIIAFEKKSGTDDVLILINARNSVQNYSVPVALQNSTWTDGFTNANVPVSVQLTFQPYGYMVLKK